ncbi:MULTISPECIES: YidH family protein [Acidianus]|uniref:Membrane protein n=1 Tax=Candidatus Acidianus copahuensis TaxID=1160895 RepID=A0A031LRJ5_9CREN|nr:MULTISPECIES: DUF202 domain-containing protein [Acidianus]EZQ07039.1 membrane protein [Candidatus Acidianus copahuensis]NON62911.1 DUF202 domain-containing protein [Acidianus sp. RZ1]
MGSPSDHFANERTFLAWIRTGIALIGFGFVIAKFAIFLQLLKIETSGSQSSFHASSSVAYGEVMILMGGMVIAYGLYNYVINERQLTKNSFQPKTASNALFAVIILIVSIVLALLIL